MEGSESGSNNNNNWWTLFLHIEYHPYYRPILIVLCAMWLFNLPTFIYKIRMAISAVLYLVFCNDKSWTKPRDPNQIFGPILKATENNNDSSGNKQQRKRIIERKTIYFVRHGESTWNDTFNKGSHRSAIIFAIGFVPGLIKAILFEIYIHLSGKLDSWFYDAPISTLGLNQANELSKFLKQKQQSSSSKEDKQLLIHLKILSADPHSPPSKMLCSNLRRAVSTLAAGFRERLSRRPQEKILILPALQEISRNPDTLSITPSHTPIQASWVDKTSSLCDFQEIFTNQVDMSLHIGNKPLDSNGLKRMNAFCDYLFTSSIQEDYVIVGGHSLWFRSFFQTFLPYTYAHISKKKKMVNGAVVCFDLLKTNTKAGPVYMIDSETVYTVYGGFH